MLIGVPAMLLLLLLRKPAHTFAPLEGVLETIRPWWTPVLALGVALGIVLGGLIFAETVYSIVFETNYGEGLFWCDEVAGR